MLSVQLEVLPIPVWEVLGLGPTLDRFAFEMIQLLDASFGRVEEVLQISCHDLKIQCVDRFVQKTSQIDA
jgi:hypothetical protein